MEVCVDLRGERVLIGTEFSNFYTAVDTPQCEPVGNPLVVVINLGRSGVPRGRFVAGQLSDRPLRAGLINFMLCVPVLNSRGLSLWLFGVRFGPLFHRHIGG
jgi:hypothetical protein